MRPLILTKRMGEIQSQPLLLNFEPSPPDDLVDRLSKTGQAVGLRFSEEDRVKRFEESVKSRLCL